MRGNGGKRANLLQQQVKRFVARNEGRFINAGLGRDPIARADGVEQLFRNFFFAGHGARENRSGKEDTILAVRGRYGKANRICPSRREPAARAQEGRQRG